jgi:hypothetical protein
LGFKLRYCAPDGVITELGELAAQDRQQCGENVHHAMMSFPNLKQVLANLPCHWHPCASIEVVQGVTISQADRISLGRI